MDESLFWIDTLIAVSLKEIARYSKAWTQEVGMTR